MGILARFTFKSLARNRMRTVVTVLGVMLSAALLTAVLTTVASVIGMMYNATVAQEGSYQVSGHAVSKNTVEKAAADERVEALAVSRELGSAVLEPASSTTGSMPVYIHVATLPAAQKGEADTASSLTPEIRLESGHMPQTEDEIIVPLAYRGDTYPLPSEEGVTVDGSGTATDADAAGGAAASGAATGTDTAGAGNASAAEEPAAGVSGTVELDGTLDLQLGTRIDRTTGQALGSGDSSWSDDQPRDEGIEGAEPRSYTVVGFYEDSMFTLPASSGFIAYTAADAAGTGTGLCNAWLSASSVTSYDGMRELADDLFGQEHGELHTMMLYLMGLADGRSLFGALYGFAAVLGVVIAVASVSLIYNSFQISVSERTRQFGLLSSLGASKRQLRRSVLTESLFIALVGIPLGLALGLIGCVVVFHFAGAGLAGLFGVGDGLGSSLPVVVKPTVLLLAAAATLACILVSAWVPAVRASRVSAVDAIRQTRDVRLSRRSMRKLAHQGSALATRFLTERDVAPKGLSARVFGIPGFVAHSTLSRNAAKGRIAIASLAVSVTLIVVAGSFSDTFMLLSGAVNDTQDSTDLTLQVTGTETDDPNRYAPTPEERDRLLADLAAMDGVEDVRCLYDAVADARLEAGALTSSIEGVEDSEILVSANGDGSYAGVADLVFLDDKSWEEACASAGIDPASLPSDEPVAIALNSEVQTSINGRYASYRTFSGEDVGSFELVQVEEKDGYTATVFTDEGGNDMVNYYDYNNDETFNVPLDEAMTSSRTVPVAGIADDQPACAVVGSDVTFMLPLDSYQAFPELVGYDVPQFSISTGGDARAARQVEEQVESYMENHIAFGYSVQNIAESAEQNRMLALSMQVFTYCFAGITGLIAVANVFNTLANSIMLRRREFAVLKSIGMGERSFMKMIAYECASYTVRGFAIGLVLSTIACYMLYSSLGIAMAGVSFTLPWGNVALAFGLVLAVIAASVAFALGKCHTNSIVEALRTEAM